MSTHLFCVVFESRAFFFRSRMSLGWHGLASALHRAIGVLFALTPCRPGSSSQLQGRRRCRRKERAGNSAKAKSEERGSKIVTSVGRAASLLALSSCLSTLFLTSLVAPGKRAERKRGTWRTHRESSGGGRGATSPAAAQRGGKKEAETKKSGIGSCLRAESERESSSSSSTSTLAVLEAKQGEKKREWRSNLQAFAH